MKVSIFGLGYVGTVTAACLAGEGHQIIGVDPLPEKVGLINSGQSPIIEVDIEDIIKKVVDQGSLVATDDPSSAIENTDISLVCVGTPSQLNGNLDLRYVRRVCERIGKELQKKDSFHVVVIRSTILPGSMRETVIPILEESSGKDSGIGFGICNNPEFLREGTSVHDFYNPPKTVIGQIDKKSGDKLASLYDNITAPMIRTDLETAEMVKYVDNVWHALKIGFANEVGNICKSVNIDGHQVMEIFCQDRKLNISSAYLKPGFAFGGSCLPKDLRALNYCAKSNDLELPIMKSILISNRLQVQRGLNMIIEKGKKKIGILGFSFKAGTDDLRESPMVEIIERLIGKGYDLCIFDRNVNIASLVGANRDYILNVIPHISKLMVKSIDEVLAHAETIVIGNSDAEFKHVLDQVVEGQIIVDFARLETEINDMREYDGICW